MGLPFYSLVSTRCWSMRRLMTLLVEFICVNLKGYLDEDKNIFFQSVKANSVRKSQNEPWQNYPVVPEFQIRCGHIVDA